MVVLVHPLVACVRLLVVLVLHLFRLGMNDVHHLVVLVHLLVALVHLVMNDDRLMVALVLRLFRLELDDVSQLNLHDVALVVEVLDDVQTLHDVVLVVVEEVVAVELDDEYDLVMDDVYDLVCLELDYIL